LYTKINAICRSKKEMSNKQYNSIDNSQPSAPPYYEQESYGYDTVTYFDFVYKHDRSIQRNFLLKVYSLLTIQLVATTVFIAINVFVPAIRRFNIEFFPIAIALMLSSMVFLFVLYCVMKLYPWNFVCLGIWTLMFGWSIGMVCSMYYAYEVMLAFGVTAMITISLSGYVLITKARLHWLGMTLMVCLLGLLIASFFTMFFSLFFSIGRWWLFALSGFGAILFSLFILYDTSRIIHDCKPDEVIPASIILYTDIINLFLNILRLIALARRN
jgi:FtsH-binding integral membrane protein